jgi:ribonuclease Z
MPTLHLLGTGAALSDAHRTTTMLALSSERSAVVVDCGGDVVQRLLAAGVDLDTITALIVTHEHPDHAGGFPLFMERIWLAGRRRPLDVYGIAPAIDQARRCFATFDTSRWTGLPEIRWNEVEHRAGALVFEDESWRVTASPGQHSVPVIGLRVENRQSGGVVAYSCDTEASDDIARLAEGASILLHEASGAMSGHSSAEDAARIAAQARVSRLVLVHLPPGLSDADLVQARRIFPAMELGAELSAYEF